MHTSRILAHANPLSPAELPNLLGFLSLVVEMATMDALAVQVAVGEVEAVVVEEGAAEAEMIKPRRVSSLLGKAGKTE